MKLTTIQVLPFFLNFSAIASPIKESCNIPAHPINWIMRYCAVKNQTDDEITIQNSQCFKTASKDLSTKEECKIKTKYKKKFCLEYWLKNRASNSSLAKCLMNQKIQPFHVGN